MPRPKRPTTRRPAARSGRSVRRLPLSSLRVFVAAAEELSFTRAALELGVTGAAVSMQIRALEEYLRSPLFRRRGRLIELTLAGERLLPRVRSALQDLERAVDEARLERTTGPLTISMLASFLQEWLLPRLPEFQRQHPAIDLRIHTSPSLVDFLHSDVQAAIRFGTGIWPHLHSEKLIDDWFVPVCTPQVLERLGPVESPQDLGRHQLLHSSSEPWRAWLEGEANAEEWAPRGTTFDDSTAVLRAASAGQGLALSRWSLCAQEVGAGRLVVASRALIPLRQAYFFVCPPAYLATEKLARFRAWLIERGREAPRPPGH
jgi:LysR family transcriptional regulator, glycine cleavage system transcriptional activator